MSTLPSVASKGEKEKSKYQSIDINRLYRNTLGESLENKQQKTTLSQKHGMQSLGKVPNTRRPPANLPSLKSEHSGSDTAVSLVPSIGSGWGKQESTVLTPTAPNVNKSTNSLVKNVINCIQAQQQQQQQQPQSNNSNSAATSSTVALHLTPHQAAIALPVTTTIQAPSKPSVNPAANPEKSWSSVMIGDANAAHPPPYQSPQFQQEFPTLSSGDGVALRSAADGQYAPGLSLRPQTEGSWMQGGSGRSADAAGRTNLAVPVGQQPLSAPVGPPLPPTARGFVPNFMFRANNGFQTNGMTSQPPNVVPQPASALRRDVRGRSAIDLEELSHRPIIKEEDLSGMDNLTGDIGWAINDDIDYNQKLAFSDDESDRKCDKEALKTTSKDTLDKTEAPLQQEVDHKSWSVRNAAAAARNRHEHDEFSAQRKEIASAVERAKQRKEEEEKKYNESRKAGAQKKLQELEERIGKSKRDKDNDETGGGTINPASVPPQTIAPVPILLPEWEREKEGRTKVSAAHEDVVKVRGESDFKQLTQIEGRATFARKDSRSHEKEQIAAGGQTHSFSKQFQNDLPPRFQKQQQQQMNAHVPQSFNYENRWSGGNRTSPSNRKDEKELDDRLRDYRTHRAYGESDRKVNDDEKMLRKERHEKADVFERPGSDEWQSEKKYDRPQRPDSRDSRASRESRVSEPREYSSWAEEPIEEMKKKEHRKVVPGPITKEKLEADDLRNEKSRNLTQLKRGFMSEKKVEKVGNDEDTWGALKKNDEPKAWADSVPAVEKTAKDEKRDEDEEQKEKFDKDEKKMVGRMRTDSQSSRGQGWGANMVYRNTWSSNNNKKNMSATRGQRGPRGKDVTESEGSADDSCAIDTAAKKFDKVEKGREVKVGEKAAERKIVEKPAYVPRGEPTRHGRGGGSGSFRGSRGGSKRVDTYGPPAKSAFSNVEEKEKKFDESEDKSKGDDKSRKRNEPPRKIKPKLDGDVSDNSDVDRKPKNPPRSNSSILNRRGGSSMIRLPPNERSRDDKRGFGQRMDGPHNRQTSNVLQTTRNVIKDERKKENALSLADMSIKDEELKEEEEVVVERDESGFQEVKNKKPERKPIEKPKEDSKTTKTVVKTDVKIERAKSACQITPQQMASIPSLMATPVNPPVNMPPPQTSNKPQFDRNRQNKTLAPRFAKAREHNRMHKMQISGEDVSKINQNNMYGGMKDGQHIVATALGSNAWDKPLPAQLRVDQDVVGIGLEACKPIEVAMHHASSTQDEKAVIDGSKPLTTIIFENTNYKSAPGARNRNEKPRCAKIEESLDSIANYKPISELMSKEKSSDISSMPSMFNKDDTPDMKLDFLESEITQITEDKSSKLTLSRSNIASTNNILNADTLNMKIASVKRVWEAHGNDDSFGSFNNDPSSMDESSAFSKTEDPNENHDVYGSSPNPNASNSTTNVCKVKPTQQVAGSAGQSLLNASGAHPAHSNLPLMGHSLSSPPPIQPVIGPLGQPQQYTANTHLGYQAGLGSNQYGGLPAPSPPTVLNYTAQQLQQTGLYAPFQIDQSQVMSNQGRSQYSQYPFGLGQTGSSPYSPSMYLPAGQPPPNAQPELYQNMNSYRLPNTGPFGQNQQLSNPTTVLISSTSNSLMSPSVKPSNQPISAIGTKAGGVGQAYQQQSQQGQVYMSFDPPIPNAYMQNPNVIQRGPPTGPVQNNVVAGMQPTALQPSTSFYSASTGGQTGYFQGPGNSPLQSQMSQQTGFGLTQSVFPTHNQSHNNAGMQNYGQPYYGGQMQQLAAMTQQQFRSASMQTPQYLKNQLGDQGRQQLKSPGTQQTEVMSSVFNTGSQIASPKSRQQMKQPPPQPSPTAQHSKYMYSPMSNPQNVQTRYPTPIQRPAGNYQSQMGNNVPNNVSQKSQRMNTSNNRTAGSRQYYGPQGGSINNQSDKHDDAKLDNVVNTSTTNASNIAPKAAASQVSADKSDAKEESCAKD